MVPLMALRRVCMWESAAVDNRNQSTGVTWQLAHCQRQNARQILEKGGSKDFKGTARSESIIRGHRRVTRFARVRLHSMLKPPWFVISCTLNITFPCQLSDSSAVAGIPRDGAAGIHCSSPFWKHPNLVMSNIQWKREARRSRLSLLLQGTLIELWTMNYDL